MARLEAEGLSVGLSGCSVHVQNGVLSVRGTGSSPSDGSFDLDTPLSEFTVLPDPDERLLIEWTHKGERCCAGLEAGAPVNVTPRRVSEQPFCTVEAEGVCLIIAWSDPIKIKGAR